MGLTWWWQTPQQAQPPAFRRRPAAGAARAAGRRPLRHYQRCCGNVAHRSEAVRMPTPTTISRKDMTDGQDKQEPAQAPNGPRSPTARKTPCDGGFHLGGFLGSSGGDDGEAGRPGRSRADPLARPASSRASIPKANSAASTASPSRPAWATRASGKSRSSRSATSTGNRPAIPWLKTCASRSWTFTRKTTTCWCWPRSPA